VFSNLTTYAFLIPRTRIQRIRIEEGRHAAQLQWRRRWRTSGAERDGLCNTTEEGHHLHSRPGDLKIGSLKHNSYNSALKLAVKATILLS
jgi:hypothetical protein